MMNTAIKAPLPMVMLDSITARRKLEAKTVFTAMAAVRLEELK
jgi:hypothetical protein